MFAAKPRVNLVLDTLILFLFVVALGSGLLLEYVYAHGGGGGGGYRGGRGSDTAQVVTGTDSILGISRAEMDTLHLYSALATAAGVGVHLVFHLHWIVCQLRRLVRPAAAPQPAVGQHSAAEQSSALDLQPQPDNVTLTR